MTPAARIAAAIDLLIEIDAAPTRPADAVANDFFRARRYIGSHDRRAVSERVWHVLRGRRRLSWWLRDTARTGRLLIAASLLLDGWSLDSVAEVFSGGRFAAASLDQTERAALRPIAGHGWDHPAMPDAVRLEIPDWLLPRLQARFGASLATEMAALAEPAPLDLRVNLLKTTREQARAALSGEGWDARPTRFSPWGLRIEGRRPVTSGPAFQHGLVEIQDEGSQLVALIAGARPGMRVVDLCAGAGGKTLALAAMMENRGQIVACDVSAARLDGAVRRLRRAGAHNVERHLLVPGDKWAKRRAGGFDRVLVDAPCTGTGTWRRNPDARLRLTETDLMELLTKQSEILDLAQSLVRKGGRLVYATCSLLQEENEAQVSAFLARHPDFRVIPLGEAWPLATPAPNQGDYLSLTPAGHGTDGFFTAVLERAA
ncbi:RsmB/NOP family class I SAM-dependent RNA methyltransferase [Rhodopila sp.]|uniref:RsmB/NOP family class I SAM-dependent RNA methyltransferase n=1 Tax=Rhodopila sp. TaxID=2480087 RepID=UPI002C227DA0|nr:RsmB/NOP family class I SAM-dependent RNA methyltransferase [Rhodopila sp.]HVZ07264.1 RsmB/NOP family class I SAM-dependent RNA methyltransferase [Rhodopila sp.]